MTALPDHRTPLTAAEYAVLPADHEARYELQEGWIMMSPRPTPRHQRANRELVGQLVPQLPDYEVLPEVDVDLQLAPPSRPGTVRVPDVVVVSRNAFARADDDGSLLTASDVLLVVEFLSPGSTRIDTLVKHQEYAEAGIGHYWIIDLHDGPSLVACHLAGEFGYQDAQPVCGTFTTDTPVPLRIDLDTLLS
ncbi:MAG: Uma2 family endonuclease [Dermatophilaceae bacterium]